MNRGGNKEETWWSPSTLWELWHRGGQVLLNTTTTDMAISSVWGKEQSLSLKISIFSCYLNFTTHHDDEKFKLKFNRSSSCTSVIYLNMTQKKGGQRVAYLTLNYATRALINYLSRSDILGQKDAGAWLRSFPIGPRHSRTWRSVWRELTTVWRGPTLVWRGLTLVWLRNASHHIYSLDVLKLR